MMFLFAVVVLVVVGDENKWVFGAKADTPTARIRVVKIDRCIILYFVRV